jgi:diguanylate cyclase (GGDEF)-like protein
VLSIDVDHFKSFNDNHGHDAGDVVLRHVGESMRRVFRDHDVACRFGGEEFVVLLPGATSAVAAERAEDLRATIEALTVRYAETNLPRVTISIGIAAFPDAGQGLADVLKVADEALYEAKRLGRNQIVLSAACEAAIAASDGLDEEDADAAWMAACHAQDAREAAVSARSSGEAVEAETVVRAA